ncbi:F-box-like/WD repeat-containing protein TBL1Y [Psilocybe cubensis]|uniref:F-box-like/WD repeat-containing protein TBL1Y n=2 Tax=Psilocybe cubensis TaxID=181762 RepID=A0ACB8HF72_PSICU|nr:F-box-like/WD repeat-containing protein TBL1Y [Psilocybe cubensis]KAH9486362.1 F-box-like/WD repeat-containing protein TBL1Y [Psilocybe cubensis]
MISPPNVITSEEVNCLIYSYFQDCGFNHSAFALRNEGRLQNSPFSQKHIPRGQLVDLLSKALLYIEVEAHWRNDSLTTNCKSNFSLIDHHICSLDAPQETHDSLQDNQMDIGESDSISTHGITSSLANTSRPYATSQPKDVPSRNGPQTNDTKAPNHTSHRISPPRSLPSAPDINTKRKTSPIPSEGPVEKRARRASTDMDIDERSESAASTSQDLSLKIETNRASTRMETRAQGPGDNKTDPRVMLLLPGHQTEVFVCAFNPKMHNLLASGSKDAVVNLWDLPDPPTTPGEYAESPGEPLVLDNVSRAVQGDLTSLHWNREGTLLAIGSYDSILRVCTDSGSVYFSHPQHQKGPIFSTRFSKDGSWLLTASLDGTTCLWDVKEKRLHRQYRCHKDCCLDIEWLSEDTFASAGADMRIFVMRVDEDEPIKTLVGHKDEINQIRVNPAGTRLASCSDDGTAHIWRVDNIDEAADSIPGLSASDHGVSLKGHTHSVSTVGWCVDHPAGTNELLATSSFDCTARLWDSVTGECLHVFKDHRAPLYALTFSPDGKFFATGSGDGWLHLYQTRTYARIWSWFAGFEKPGIFEIDWQEYDGVNRIAMALECRQVAVLDVNKLDSYRTAIAGEKRTASRIEEVVV